MIVARREIKPAASHWFLVFRFHYRQVARLTQKFAQPALTTLPPVLHHNNRQRKFRGQSGKQCLQCLQAASRGSHYYNLECHSSLREIAVSSSEFRVPSSEFGASSIQNLEFVPILTLLLN